MPSTVSSITTADNNLFCQSSDNKNNNSVFSTQQPKASQSKEGYYSKLQEYAKANNLNLYELFGNFDKDEETCRFLLKELQEGKDPKELKINLLCNKYGIDKKDINEGAFDNFIKAVESVENELNQGKIKNKKDAKRKILDYTVALNYDWDCIDDYKKYNSDNNDTDNLIQRLTRYRFLKRKNDSKYTNDEIKAACRKYFKAFKTLKKPADSDPNLTEEQWQKKLFRQTFSKLLINTLHHSTSEQKKFLAPIIEELKKEYLDEAIDNLNTLTSEDQEQRTVVSDIAAKTDNVQNNASEKTLQKVISNASEEVAVEVSTKLNDEACKTFKESEIKALIEKSKTQKLTESEQKALDEYINKQRRAVAAEAGIHDSVNIKTENKSVRVADLDNKTREFSEDAYREKQKIKYQFISENIPKDEQEKYIKFFDKVSNGNFSKIIENHDCELNPPVDVKKLTEGAQAELGLKQQQETKPVQAEAKAQELRKQIIEQSQADEAPAIVNNTPKTQKTDGDISSSADKEPVSVADQILNLAQLPFIEILNNPDFSIAECIKKKVVKLDEAMKNFGHLAKSDQQSIEQNYIKPNSETEQLALINKIGSNTEKGRLAIKFGLEDDEKKLDLDFNTRKRLESA